MRDLKDWLSWWLDAFKSFGRIAEATTVLDFGQATKGAWWMPWGKEPMKGAVTGETHRGAGNKH